MVMTEACQHVADVHPSVLSLSEAKLSRRDNGRMPVILRRDDWADWLDGAPDAAGLLCRPYPELMVCERTAESWRRTTLGPGVNITQTPSD